MVLRHFWGQGMLFFYYALWYAPVGIVMVEFLCNHHIQKISFLIMDKLLSVADYRLSVADDFMFTLLYWVILYSLYITLKMS